ncbi:uncharacterized protein LOC113097606 [Carassius auratus]|uniref:Uncharacterized protein LOC113097606 n=1 Tax=Carassius auratus TaxID=7957 RepID=A0A6P6PDA6_CARAU|nr:uncharacterized protein LOC113097606 [Carassius auratus]
MVRTLNNVSELRQTGFGQPSSRHCLSLLWWFAHDCVKIGSNGRMIAQYDPRNGAFGFELFHNRESILPYSDLLYYEVGNLHKARSLPPYVIEKYTGYSEDSNTDRIIVSFNSRLNKFEKIYVTQHSDQKNFEQNRTYCISTDLLKDIKELSREDFLRGRTNRSEQFSISMPPSVQRRQTNTCLSWKCRCALIGCSLLFIAIVGGAIALCLYLKPK